MVAVEGGDLHTVQLLELLLVHPLLQDGPADDQPQLGRHLVLAVVGALELQALHAFQQAVRLGLGVLLVAFHAEAEAGQFLGRGQAAEGVIVAYEGAGGADAGDGVSPGRRRAPKVGGLRGEAAGAAEAADRSHLLALAEVRQHAFTAGGVLQVGIVWGPRDGVLLWRKDIELFKPGPPLAVPLESPFGAYRARLILVRILTLQRQNRTAHPLGLAGRRGQYVRQGPGARRLIITPAVSLPPLHL